LTASEDSRTGNGSRQGLYHSLTGLCVPSSLGSGVARLSDRCNSSPQKTKTTHQTRNPKPRNPNYRGRSGGKVDQAHNLRLKIEHLTHRDSELEEVFCPLSSEYSTRKTVTARFCPWLSLKNVSVVPSPLGSRLITCG